MEFRPPLVEQMSRNMEVFELKSASLNIRSQSHVFAEVTFTPQSIQMYNAQLEVAMEGASRYEGRCVKLKRAVDKVDKPILF